MKPAVVNVPATQVFVSGAECYPEPESDPRYPSEVVASLTNSGGITLAYKAHAKRISIPMLSKEVDSVIWHAIALPREEAERFAKGILDLLKFGEHL